MNADERDQSLEVGKSQVGKSGDGHPRGHRLSDEFQTFDFPTLRLSNPIRVHPRSSAAHPLRAFTLIELLLVLVILGVLAALVVPRFTNRSQQARETAAKAD